MYASGCGRSEREEATAEGAETEGNCRDKSALAKEFRSPGLFTPEAHLILRRSSAARTWLGAVLPCIHKRHPAASVTDDPGGLRGYDYEGTPLRRG